MHIFVTGATGWVGAAVVNELLAAGHRVTGLARSDDKAAGLAATGAGVLRATLDDHDTLSRAAADADAVIHTAFNHDFSRFAENAAQDQRVIAVLGAALEGSDRPLLVTSGLSGLPRGATEADTPAPVCGGWSVARWTGQDHPLSPRRGRCAHAGAWDPGRTGRHPLRS